MFINVINVSLAKKLKFNLTEILLPKNQALFKKKNY
jgi:hypothetical protein